LTTKKEHDAYFIVGGFGFNISPKICYPDELFLWFSLCLPGNAGIIH